MNPIYIEYYSHERCDCYKINLPWTRYKQERMVLCRVNEGYPRAQELAKEVISKHLKEVTIEAPQGQQNERKFIPSPDFVTQIDGKTVIGDYKTTAND